MSTLARETHEPHCDECGQPGAHEFDRASLCVDCYQQGASSCAGRRCDDEPDREPDSSAPATTDTHRVNPNCCYSSCPRCSSLRRLREFQARFPVDWPARLRGLSRIVALAQQVR